MVVFCNQLRISFDVTMLLLMTTFPRYIKTSNGSWFTVITAGNGTSCVVFGFILIDG